MYFHIFIPVSQWLSFRALNLMNAFGLLPSFWKTESRPMRSPCWLCVCDSSLLPFEFLNDFYETWHVYHDTWVHLNGVLRKSLSSVCVSMCINPIVAGQSSVKIPLSLAGNGSVEMLPRQPINATIEDLLNLFSVRSTSMTLSNYFEI
jgi:hypothetical protein